MREGTLITRRVKLPVPHNPALDTDYMHNYAKSWVEEKFSAGDYFIKSPESEPKYYKLVNYEILVDDVYNENEIVLKLVTVYLVFKKLDEVPVIHIDKLGR